MEVFKWIRAPDHKHNENEVMERKYKSIHDFNGRFVTRNFATGRFVIFPNLVKYRSEIEKIPEEQRCFHEVIFGSQPQKLKFDIDAELEKVIAFKMPMEEGENVSLPPVTLDPEILELLDGIDDTPKPIVDENQAKIDHVVSVITKAVKDTFFITYGFDPDLVICESKSSKTPVAKWSYHLITASSAVTSNQQAVEFTRRFKSCLPAAYHPFIDWGVNKSIQDFRLTGNRKEDSDRVKTIISNHTFEDSVITETAKCKMLPDIVVETGPKPVIEMHPDDVEKVLMIAKPHAKDHRFRIQRGGEFVFERLRPTHCDICSRQHDNDNTLVINIGIKNGIVSVFKRCRHAPETAPVPIGDFASSTVPAELVLEPNERKLTDWSENVLNKHMKDLTKGVELFPSRSLFDDLPANLKQVYSEPALRPFETSRTLCVNAQMKMGKTKALKEYILKHFNDGIKQPIIRFVSFRQTFSGNIKEKFADFTMYSDVKGVLNQRKLIVQVESLYRIDIRPGQEPPDLLVLDECESIFEQFDSGLLRNFSGSFAAFQWMLRHSKHVICMDAGLSDRTFRVLQRMRPGFADPAHGVVYHCNKYQNARDDKYLFTTDKLRWLGLLYTALDNDEKVAIPMSSLTEAKTLVKNISKRYPTKRVKLYSSETLMSEKKTHFADVNTHWLMYDVLVYTPTVSAGVSFEQKHFDQVFGYFTDQSCPVETCIQMVGRIRDVRSRQYTMCLCATSNTLPVDIELIKKYLYEKRENLMKQMDDSLLTFEYGPNGDIKYHNSDYFQLWLENTRVKNLSKNSFVRRFIHMVALTGAKCRQLTDQIFTELTGTAPTIDGELNADLATIKDEHKEAKAELSAEATKKIAEAKELSQNEIEDIQNAIVAQQDITEGQRFAYAKYKLRRDYAFEGEIDESFVAKYNDPKVKRMFKNINRVSSCANIEEALRQIQKEERANYQFVMNLDERAQQGDISHKYVFEQHRLALGLLKACGWTSIKDPKFIPGVTLADNLRANERMITDNLDRISAEFNVRKPQLAHIVGNRANDTKYNEILTGFMNKVLYTMYGIRVTARKNEPDMFFISHNNLFAVRAEEAKKMPMVKAPARTFSIE